MTDFIGAICPHCGTASGHFEDPRYGLIRGGWLGQYFCGTCRRGAPLIDVLRATDERMLEALLEEADP